VRRFGESELALIWDRRSEGVGMRTVARELGRAHGSVRWMVESYGGVRPHPRIRSSRHLSLEEREEISRGVASREEWSRTEPKSSQVTPRCWVAVSFSWLLGRVDRRRPSLLRSRLP
jgi:hypothetical protein